jgi:2-hydroxychromene-2-carboxylate isomerase
MAHPIEFYFDFSSPYGYMASTKIDELAARHGREVIWRPILLGVAFRTTGGQPLPQVPLKGDYARRDFVRSARFHGVEFSIPTSFPVSAVTPSRAFYWAEKNKNPEAAIAIAKALLRAYFVENVNIANPDDTVAVCTRLGYEAEVVHAGINAAATKELLKAEVDTAIARGVFGSPYIIVDGEPFWGHDRLDQVERWLAKGPW